MMTDKPPQQPDSSSNNKRNVVDINSDSQAFDEPDDELEEFEELGELSQWVQTNNQIRFCYKIW